MKKNLLLSAFAAFTMAATINAQTDVTPANLKFESQAVGSAASLFIKEANAIGGGSFISKNVGSRKGYRYADNAMGGFSLAQWTGETNRGWDDLTASEKADYEEIMNAFQIINAGGDVNKIMVYQGPNSDKNDYRFGKSTKTMSSPSIYIVSKHTDMTAGIYRVTMGVRVINNVGANSNTTFNTYTGTSWWDGMPLAPATGQDYANFQIGAQSFLDDYWTEYQFELNAQGNSDGNYDAFPFLVKIGLGNVANRAVIMFNDIKIEKVPSATLGGSLKTIEVEWVESPAVKINQTLKNDSFVLVNTNGVQVVDAKETINVFSTSGQLIKTVAPVTSITNLELSQKGTYIVKVGATTHKVVL